MKILFWQEDHPTVHGGAESWLKDTAAGLRLLGHEVAWLYSDQIQQAVDSFRPDVVTIGTIHNFIGLQHAQYLLDQHIPAVWFMHDYWPFCRPRMLMQEMNKSDRGCEAVTGICEDSCHPDKAEAQASRQAVLALVNQCYVVTGCDGAAAIMRRNGVNVRAVVEEGIDTDLFKPGEGERDISAVYASAAGDEIWKGMHILRQALEGAGIELRLLTGLSRPQLAEALRSAAIYVFPSVYQEIWGLALTEAMASGCACITTDVAGGRAQAHHGAYAQIVPAGDPVALRAAIQQVVRLPKSRAVMGEVARRHVEQEHSLIATAKRWESVYAEVAACAV